MRTLQRVAIVSVGLMLVCPVSTEAANLPVRSPGGQTADSVVAGLPAFPGAEGFGAYARGGRGGRVYHVTTLEDGGAGSLREAVEAEGPRIVVFDVAGTLLLKKALVIRNPFLTIAGQTAPGDGICLRDATLSVEADHVVIRHLRCRLGDQGRGGDALSIGAGRHILLDHCSASWSLDEVLSCSTGEPKLSEVTVQWCFITEALNPQNHGFGSLIRGCHGARYSFHHNLYAHNRGRNPRPGNYDEQNPHEQDPNGLLLDFRNNVIYNWSGSYAGYNADKESVTRLNYVGNYLVPGPDSTVSGRAYREGSVYNRSHFLGNYYNHRLPEDPWSLVIYDDTWTAAQIAAHRQSQPFETGPIATMDAGQAYREVLRQGGACRPRRDAVDRRIVEEVTTGRGHILLSQAEVGGWPRLRTAPAPRDRDGDGMPDAWEQERGLNPADAADGPQDRDADGYTNVEEYLNSLVEV
ncbi:MAG: pectate lyase [Planctomycetes bacterium]|nr:pectate lyase [Planctomycetota bacterium]